MGDQGQAGADLSERAIEWLVALDCGTADSQAFEAWRNSDPRHAAAFVQVAATWRRTADPRVPTLLEQSSSDRSEERAALTPETGFAEARPVSRRAVAGGALAAMLGIGGIASFLAWPSRAYAETALGERKTIQLPDGSHAMLNTDTRLAWRFDDSRDVWIEQGEATLLVRKAGKPFRIYSDPFDARLSDGKFNVRLNPAGGQLLVFAGQAATVYSGTQARTLQAGHSLTVGSDAARFAQLTPDVLAAATAWEHGEIVFNGMTLDEAVAEFNRYLARKIVLQNATLGATRLGGAFKIAQPEAFLLALQDGFDIKHRPEGDQILLYRGHAR
jgi:transmembrane sensor